LFALGAGAASPGGEPSSRTAAIMNQTPLRNIDYPPGNTAQGPSAAPFRLEGPDLGSAFYAAGQRLLPALIYGLICPVANLMLVVRMGSPRRLT
jgi:hypothetical protein